MSARPLMLHLPQRVRGWLVDLLTPPEASELAEQLDVAQNRVGELEEHLAESERHLRERTELLYDLQRQYSSEHFNYQETLRNLKIEEMRRSGATADRDVMLGRFKLLQTRIAELRERLGHYEDVPEEWIDTTPIVLTERK